MTVTRKLIIAFWIFIVIMLGYSFYNYNQGLTQDAIQHPQQDHYFFIHTNAPPAVAQAPDGASVIQTNFVARQDTPGTGSFTCLVTLKNVGNRTATNIQICVRPYRGASTADIDTGGEHGGPLAENDPLSQFNDWLTFPDLAPGESATQSDVFTTRPEIGPGRNPDPKIVFESAKAATAPK